MWPVFLPKSPKLGRHNGQRSPAAAHDRIEPYRDRRRASYVSQATAHSPRNGLCPPETPDDMPSSPDTAVNESITDRNM